MGRNREFDEEVALHKAMELFWEQGYEKTSMGDLVEHMGIHRKSLYDTFGDKHTLYLKAIDCYKEHIKDKIKEKTLSAETSSKAIETIFEYAIGGDKEKSLGCLLVNATTELALRDREVEEKTEESFLQTESLFAERVRKGQQTGEFSKNFNADDLAGILHSTLLGIRVYTRTSVSKEKLHHIVDNLLAMFKN